MNEQTGVPGTPTVIDREVSPNDPAATPDGRRSEQVGAVSLAAAIGGMLLGVNGPRPR